MTPDGSHGRTPLAVPVGLVLLVGPPGSGKSSFARAWVECGRIDADGIVSCDLIRQQLFGEDVDSTDDAAIFEEMDSRVAANLHRTGRERVPMETVLGSASVMRAVASAEHLRAEGAGTVIDVPGEENQFDAGSAAALIGFQPA